jgi:hypothetical protein
MSCPAQKFHQPDLRCQFCDHNPHQEQISLPQVVWVQGIAGWLVLMILQGSEMWNALLKRDD